MGCRISQEEHLTERMKVTADLEQQLQTSVARRMAYQNAIFESNRSSISSWIASRTSVSFMSNSPSVVTVAVPYESASVNLLEQSDRELTPTSETYSTQIYSSSTGENPPGNRRYVTYVQHSPTNASNRMSESIISVHYPENCSGVNRGYVTNVQNSPTYASNQMCESIISEQNHLGQSDWTQLTKDYGAWAPGFQREYQPVE